MQQEVEELFQRVQSMVFASHQVYFLVDHRYRPDQITNEDLYFLKSLIGEKNKRLLRDICKRAVLIKHQKKKKLKSECPELMKSMLQSSDFISNFERVLKDFNFNVFKMFDELGGEDYKAYSKSKIKKKYCNFLF